MTTLSPLDNAKKIFQDRGCTPLFTEYKNCKSKLDYICACGTTGTTTLYTFQNSSGCRSCSSTKKKHTIDEIKQFFIDKGLTPLFDSCKNNKEPLQYQCKCGTIDNYTLQQIIVSVPHCNKCNEIEYNHVKCYFQIFGCKLLSKTIKDYDTELRFKCSCGKASRVTFNHFKNGQRCNDCGQDQLYLSTLEMIKTFAEKFNCTFNGEFTPGCEFDFKCNKCGVVYDIKLHILNKWNGCQC